MAGWLDGLAKLKDVKSQEKGAKAEMGLKTCIHSSTQLEPSHCISYEGNIKKAQATNSITGCSLFDMGLKK